jgi:DNA-binding LacI/PurR family transcriptional regulator
VHQPIVDMTMAATGALIEMIRKRTPLTEPSGLKFPHKLMIRDSAGPPGS